ncbi:MAG: kinase-like domain-containing protein [Benjaminiella poitrasii]|nr:MAG: kinase-like domain-containing protein [Benjaminiella poitrasii]
MTRQDYLDDPSLYKCVCDHYEIGKKIGEGSYGKIYEGIDSHHNQPVAFKFEVKELDRSQLKQEYLTYRSLEGSPGVPSVFYFGHLKYHRVMIMDLCGPSLEDMFKICDKKFSVKTVAMLAIEMITAVEGIHKRNFIHRDIKPDNFLISRPDDTLSNTKISLIDFGMAKRYRNPDTKEHIPYREKKGITGTARYMSVNMHLGIEQSRRDDLEAVGYVLLYFLKGELPWQGLHADCVESKYAKICKLKQSTHIQRLCAGFPEEFVKYMQYVRALGFTNEPNYEWLIGLFKTVLLGNNDGLYDWMLLKDGWQTIAAEKLTKKPLLLLPPPVIQKDEIEQVEDAIHNHLLEEDMIHHKKWSKMKTIFRIFRAQ